MQGSSPWGDLPQDEPKDEAVASGAPEPISIAQGFAPMNSGTMLAGTPEMPTGQLIYLQPPSSAPKVIGILAIIYSVVFVLLDLDGLLSSLSMSNSTLITFGVVNLGAHLATLVGGVMLVKYQRKGVMLLLVAIALSTAVGVGQLTMTEEIYDQMLADEDITQEDYDLIMENNRLFQGIGTVMVVLCGGMCGLIVAIPLMVSNNGLDDSKLFG